MVPTKEPRGQPRATRWGWTSRPPDQTPMIIKEIGFILNRFKRREPAAKEYPPLAPCNNSVEDVDDGSSSSSRDDDDDVENLGGDKAAVPLERGDMDPVNNHHHLSKTIMVIMLNMITRKL